MAIPQPLDYPCVVCMDVFLSKGELKGKFIVPLVTIPIKAFIHSLI